MTPQTVAAELPPTATLTHLLTRWSHGDRAAAEALIGRVYDDLRAIARRSFSNERRDHLLQPTALVHEAVLRLMDGSGVEWQSRSHFFGLAAVLMRRVLVDHGRERLAAKRGGRLERLPVERLERCGIERPEELVALDDALADLERCDPDKALIVELRFFGGLTVEETAECLGLSPRTVARQWRRARAFLFHQVRRGAAGNEP